MKFVAAAAGAIVESFVYEVEAFVEFRWYVFSSVVRWCGLARYRKRYLAMVL